MRTVTIVDVAQASSGSETIIFIRVVRIRRFGNGRRKGWDRDAVDLLFCWVHLWKRSIVEIPLDCGQNCSLVMPVVGLVLVCNFEPISARAARAL